MRLVGRTPLMVRRDTARKLPVVAGSSPQNGDNWCESSGLFSWGRSAVSASRGAGWALAVIAALVLLGPSRASAQWWSRAPADFEDCAEAAEKSPSKEAKTAALAECNAKFAGRRKPGGGYTYYDFMQDRSFDIAGPNPTAEEQKRIDEQYTVYLENQRRSTIASAFAARQQEELQAPPKSERQKVPLPQQRPKQQAAAPAEMRPRYRNAECAGHLFSCEWPRLSEGWNEVKKLFTSSPGKQKKS